MRLLAGKDDQFDGHITRAPGITVAHLDQVPPAPPVHFCRMGDKLDVAIAQF
jgi:ATPase subunit of ABC transporter with duplicated ATPase domains